MRRKSGKDFSSAAPTVDCIDLTAGYCSMVPCTLLDHSRPSHEATVVWPGNTAVSFIDAVNDDDSGSESDRRTVSSFIQYMASFCCRMVIGECIMGGGVLLHGPRTETAILP